MVQIPYASRKAYALEKDLFGSPIISLEGGESACQVGVGSKCNILKLLFRGQTQSFLKISKNQFFVLQWKGEAKRLVAMGNDLIRTESSRDIQCPFDPELAGL